MPATADRPAELGDAHGADRPELLTPAEVGELLRVTPQTVRRLCAAGDLPAVRIGGQWRIPIAELDARLLKVPRAALHSTRNRKAT